MLNDFKYADLLDDDGMYFCLKNMTTLTDCPQALTHEVFRRIFDISELINMDEVTRSKVLLKMTTERDLRNQMEYARKEAIEEGRAEGLEIGLAEGIAEGRAKGIAEGRAEGRAQGRAEIVRKMLEAGIERETIAEILQCQTAEIDQILD